jgi:hypothetical protein
LSVNPVTHFIRVFHYPLLRSVNFLSTSDHTYLHTATSVPVSKSLTLSISWQFMDLDWQCWRQKGDPGYAMLNR